MKQTVIHGRRETAEVIEGSDTAVRVDNPDGVFIAVNNPFPGERLNPELEARIKANQPPMTPERQRNMDFLHMESLRGAMVRAKVEPEVFPASFVAEVERRIGELETKLSAEQASESITVRRAE